MGCPGRKVDGASHQILVVADDGENWSRLEEVRDKVRSVNNNILSYVGYVYDRRKAPKSLDYCFQE